MSERNDAETDNESSAASTLPTSAGEEANVDTHSWYSVENASMPAAVYHLPIEDMNAHVAAYLTGEHAHTYADVHLPIEDANPNVDNYPPGLQQMELDLGKLNLSATGAQGIPLRIILLPKAEGVGISAHGRPTGSSEGPDNWMEANMKDAPEGATPSRVFAMSCDEEHVGCRVDHDGADFVIYFNPERNSVVLHNSGLWEIYVSRVTNGNAETPKIVMGFWGQIELDPGEWAMANSGGCLVEVKVLERTEWAVSHQAAKRQAECSENLPKKTRLLADLAADGAAHQTGVAEVASSGNALLGLNSGQAIHVGPRENGESTYYRLKRLDPVADGSASSIWKAEHSRFQGKLVAVKVLKPTGGLITLKDSAEDWMRKVGILSSIGNHFSLVQYLGADARFYSIYTEYIDARPLDQHVVGPDDDPQFRGNVLAAWRILNDMAAALSFIHPKGLTHGDIRPGTILYNPQRGAFLVGFGNGLRLEDPDQKIHSPWYTPPEFLQDPSLLDAPADMWALGVVMMWVVHRIRWPDRGPSWDLRDIHPPESFMAGFSLGAQRQMQLWLQLIQTAALTSGPEGGVIDDIVNALVKTRKDRIDAVALESRVIEAIEETPPRPT